MTEIKKTAPTLAMAVSIIALIAAVFWALEASNWSFANLWLTPDQQGQRLSKRGLYAEAAKKFDDPQRTAVALFRNGDFKAAASVFGRSDTAEAAFNRGNSLIMLGKYDGAIESFDKALTIKPGWNEALENKQIAVARRDRLKPPEGDTGGIDGDKLGADEIVFDNRPKNSGGGKDQEIKDLSKTSDEELRALWLRQVKTKPADFLRAKFSYQYSRRERGPKSQ